MMLGKIVTSFCLFLTICGMVCLILDGFFEKRLNILNVCFGYHINTGILCKRVSSWYDDDDDIEEESDPILNNY
jgi:hypothetical protein